MSFLKKLFGGTFESNRDEGESLLAEGRFGEARMAFERALDKADKHDTAAVEAMRQRSRHCRLELARGRIARADEEAHAGDFELAMELLTDAREITDDPEILEAIKERLSRYESEDARRLAGESEEISEEELLAVIAGTWTEDQAEEYAAMPDELRDALLAAHDEETERAGELLEGIIARADLPVKPRYLWLEVAKVRRAGDDAEGAIAALEQFLELVGDDDEDDLPLRITAHALMADAQAGLERFDEAKESLISMTRVAPRDHNVFLALGVYLRRREELEAAEKALTRAVELMGQMQPDFRVIRELGFTFLAMGRRAEAMESLGAVVEHLASKGEHSQFDPETVIALARLHEEGGDPMQAADLFRHLAVGYDTQHHFLYNLEAARLLRLAGGSADLVERYLVRAAELAGDDSEATAVERVRAGEAP